MKRKALITGSKGFVGPYLKSELQANGYDVFGLGKEPGAEAGYLSVDITDTAGVRGALKKIEPTHIFHLAGVSSPPFAEKNPELTNQINVEGTRNILEAALDLSTAPRVLVVSTAHVYGPAKYLPIDESHPLDGLGVYGLSRIQQEAVVRTFMKEMFIAIPRSFNHTGPGQPDAFVIPKIFKQLAEINAGKREMLELGNIDVKRDILHVSDVVRAYRLLLEQDMPGVVANVCRGVSVGLKEIISYGKMFAQLSDVQIGIDKGGLRTNDTNDLYGSNAYLKSVIDWEPTIGLEELSQEIYSYWRAKV
ncbi:MAG: GDP-mannose 4,6-dehydratase [Candidatus Magasanikbacteria bacterium]|nr:GDP-mannose 4,6-dehydratase [Candidatus Magasanikbacteria bacterium]